MHGSKSTARRPRRRLWRRRLLTVAFCLLTCAFVSSCSADRLVLGSDPGPVDPAGARRRLVARDGRTIECWVAHSPGVRAGADGDRRDPQAFVLFFVGKGARTEAWVSAVADAWRDRPVEVWGVNYPGFGGSDGPRQMDRVGPAAVAVFDELKLAAGGRPVFLQGASFGTAAALHVAARRRVDGVVLQSRPRCGR